MCEQLCAYAQGNAFVHDLPPTAQSGVCPEAEPELRRVRLIFRAISPFIVYFAVVVGHSISV